MSRASSRRVGLLALTILAFFWPAAGPAAATEPTTSLHREDRLLPLQGSFGRVLYPPEHLDRASNLSDRIEITGLELYRWSKKAVQVEVLMIDLASWQKDYEDHLYGLPARVGRRSIAVAASGTPGSVRVWEMLLGGKLPAVPGLPLHGSPEQATSLIFCDALLQLEMGRIFAENAGFADGSDLWPAEIMAHVATLAFLEEHDPAQAAFLQGAFERWGQEPGPRPLESFASTTSVTERLWFYARFHEAARILLAEDGKHTLSRVSKRIRRRKSGVDPAGVLLGEYPQLGPWLVASFGEALSSGRE